MASGETDLDILLRSMQPVLHPDEYVFCTLPPGQPLPPLLAPVATFREAEGLTCIVLTTEAAWAGLVGVYPCRWVTLTVHSSLEAVGFQARITAHLAAQGISVNPVSGYYHDHLFVPAGRVEDVLRLLDELRG